MGEGAERQTGMGIGERERVREGVAGGGAGGLREVRVMLGM